MATRIEKRPKAIEDLVRAIEQATKDVNTTCPYTIAFCNWINGLDKYLIRKEEIKCALGNQFIFRYEFRVTILSPNGQGILIEMIEEGNGKTKKGVEEKIFHTFCKRILRPYGSLAVAKTQMDAGNEKGEIVGSKVVEREGNVILEVENLADKIEVLDISSSEINKQLASTEQPFDMIKDNSLMNRWYPLQQLTIKTDSDDLFILRLPEALYNDATSINLLPLRGFIYGDFDLEFQLTINAAPMHAGRIIMGVFYCPSGYNETFEAAHGILAQTKNVQDWSEYNYEYLVSSSNTKITSAYGMVQRPHVLLDLAKSTSASILVKYNFNKPFVRILDFSKNNEVNPGVLGGHFVTLKAKMVTPLRTGNDQPQYVTGTLLYRFVRANLTGMTKQHNLTQMDIISGVSDAITLGQNVLGTGKDIINSIERQLTRKGKRITNRDKPSMQFATMPVIPRFRNHFPNGVGVADSVVLGIDARSLTTHYEDPGSGPKSYNELAKMPGIASIISWSSVKKANSEIFSEKVIPYDQYKEPQYGQDGNSNLHDLSPLPLHVASNGFMYWSGTIVYEFDFVKTAFHKGMIMISINFGKKGNNIGNNYERIVDIQETSKVKITVPYIYDTVARRTNNCAAMSAWPQPAQWSPEALPPYTQTSITITIMNPLIYIDTVANSIDIIVWKYGGPDFCLNTPCQVNNIVTYINNARFNPDDLQSFPLNNTNKYDTAMTYLDNLPHTTTPSQVRAKKEVPTAVPDTTQMDSEDFAVGPIDTTRFHTGDDTNFKNLLRVPIRIFRGEVLTEKVALFIPVIPLGVELIKWYTSPKLAMTHQSQIVRMFRMWRGTMRYTILVHTKEPVFITYLPTDGTWRRRKGMKNMNERVPGGSGQKFNPQASRVLVDPFYNDEADLTSSGNFTTMIIPSVNPTEQVEVPWNMPVNWAMMNQGGRRQQATFRDIGSGPNGHLVIYSDKPCTVSVFMSVGDDFEMAAFCGLTDNIVVSKGIRMDDCRLKTQMDFRDKECTSDGAFSDQYFSCEEEDGYLSRFSNGLTQYVKTHHVKMIKPILYGMATVLPSPIDGIVKGLVVGHTLVDVESKVTNVENSVAKVSDVVSNWKVGSENKLLNHVTSVAELLDVELARNQKNFNNIVTNLDQSLIVGKRTLTHFEETTLLKADEVLKGCSKITDGVSDLVGKVQSASSLGDLLSWVSSAFSGIGNNLYYAIENLFKQLYHALVAVDFIAIATYLKDILINLGVSTTRYLTQRIGLFNNLIIKIFKKISPWGETQMIDTQNELDSECFDTNDVQTLIGLLMGGVLSVFGSQSSPNWQYTFKEDKAKWINSLLNFKNVSGINASLALVKNIYSTVYKMMVKVIGWKDSEMEIREALSRSSGVVSEFTKNAQDFLNDYNNEAMGDPVVKSKFWITICNAYQLQASLCKIKGDTATQVLKSLCRDVIKKSNETMSLFKTSSVRYEPFVVCLEGESGIGKSFITSQISVDILKNLNLKMPSIDFRFNVSAGVDYWNLYNGQPIIIYDDWCNLVDTQSIRKEISELYQLKTSNVMNAPKAELSEKKTVVNPFAVLMATNNPFPITNTLVDPIPLYRRRDVLVKVQLKPGFDPSAENCYSNFQHLQFGFYNNTTEDQRDFDFMDFPQFQAELKRRHINYHKRETANVKARIGILSEALSEQALLNNDIEDPFTLQARSLYEAERKAVDRGVVNSLPSDVLNFEVMQLIESIEEKYKLVQAGGNSFVIKDTTQGNHMRMVDQTQGIVDCVNTYFVTPLLKSWQTLYTYLSKWMNLGYMCYSCSKSAIASGVCYSCSKCEQVYCGWCFRNNNEKCPKCTADLKHLTPPFMDLIIGYITYASIQSLMPSDWKLTLAGKLVSLITESNAGVPLLVINFMKNIIDNYNIRKNFEGPIQVSMLTQMEIDKEKLPKVIDYDCIPNLPAHYRVVDVQRDGNCLAHAIHLGMKQFGSCKNITFDDLCQTMGKKKDWFDTDTHAVRVVKKYHIPIHLLERQIVEGKEVWVDNLITKDGIKQVPYNYDSRANTSIHVVALGDNHFRGILVDKVESPDPKVFQELDTQFIKKCVNEGPILMEAINIAGEDKIKKPADWWYESVLTSVGSELVCNHDDFDKIEGINIDIKDDGFLVGETKYSFGRCNLKCSFTKEKLKKIVEAYYDAHKLTMEEELKSVLLGYKAAEECEIPKIYRSKWLNDQLAKFCKEVVEDDNWFYRLIKSVSSYSCTGVIFVILIYCFKKFLNTFCSTFNYISKFFLSDSVTQSYSERKSSTHYQQSQRLRKVARQRAGRTQINVPDTEHYTNIKNKICQNYVVFKTDQVRKMIGIGIYGSKVLIPKHYIAPLQRADKIEMQFYQARHENLILNPANLKIKYFSDKDCAIVEVSRAIYFSDIRKFFMTQSESDSYKGYKSEIMFPKDGVIHEFDIEITAILSDYEAFDDYSSLMFKTRGALQYDFEQRGACGSLVMCRNRNQPILGIHIAGHEGCARGIGARICREELGEEATFDLPDLPYELDTEGIIDFGEEVNVEYLGKVKADMTPFLPNKTNIEHSLINDHFEEPNKVAPAILSAKDPRYIHTDCSPLIYGVKKHGKPCLDFNKEFVTLAQELLCERLLSFDWTFDHKVQIYDVKTAALGLRECADYYDWLPDSTSAGWPYNVMREEKGPLKTQKKYWMQYIRGSDESPIDVVLDPQVLQDLERDMELRRKGVLAPIVFQDVLKDEKRPLEKLMKPGGTRVFSMSPINASLALRQYTLDLTSYLRSHRIDNWMAIGINPDGPEWGKLVTNLKTKGDNIFTIDYSNFGPGLNVEVASEFRTLIKNFYKKYIDVSKEDENVIDSLIYELMYSVHLAGGTLYRTKSGSPSGAAITVEINSFTHLMYVLICWQIIGKVLFLLSYGAEDLAEHSFLKLYKPLVKYFQGLNLDISLFSDMNGNFELFFEHVIGCVYGDDGIFSVSNEFCEVFNAKTIALALQVHGICATDASKSEKILAYGPLSGATFLKRRFVPHPLHRGEWLAPIELSSVEECARWIQKGQGSDIATLVNAKASLILAYGHGPKYYANWQKILNEHLAKEKLPKLYLRWENIDQMFYGAYYMRREFEDKEIAQLSEQLRQLCSS